VIKCPTFFTIFIIERFFYPGNPPPYCLFWYFLPPGPKIELNQKPTDMLTLIPFSYQGAMWLCSALIDCSDDPCYIFVTLYDRQLINHFGDEITIKTDFAGLLPKKDDTPELVMLRQAIFDAVQNTSEFIRAQARHPY
jgi:hypothetical protein